MGLQKMLTQLRGIQDSVQAEGMKEEERIDWNGVKMHLFRIFQQEQFIFQMEEPDKAYDAVAYDVGTRSPEAPLKRFLFTIHNSSTIPELQGEEIIKKAHCIMYLFEGQKMIQGFMHLKEYTELKEITKLLKIDTKYTDFEACEVRGSTEDIINGTAQIKLVEGKKQAEWGPSAAWAKACGAVGDDMKSFLGTSTNNNCRACNGTGTESCEKHECIKKNFILKKHPCIEGTCRKICTACGDNGNRHNNGTDRCELHKKGRNGVPAIAGWVYVENSATTAATDLLAKAEKEYLDKEKSEEGRKILKKSKKGLKNLKIYKQEALSKDDICKGEDIQKILRSEQDHVRLDSVLVSRSEVIGWLKVQLGSPHVEHCHAQALARLIANAENNGEPIQNCQPRFFTYDDKPSFNLISGLMQAREDIWQKNAIIELQNAMQQLNGNYKPSAPGSVATITELASQMKTFKEMNEFQKNSIKDLQIKVERLETTEPSTPQSIWTPSTPQGISQNKEFKNLKTTVENLEKKSPSTPQDISHNPSFRNLKTTVEKLASNIPNVKDISKKVTDLQTTVKLLTPGNIQTKNSVLELLSKEIECLLTLKKESPEKEEMVLNKISKIHQFVEIPKIKIRASTPLFLPSNVECTMCRGKELPTHYRYTF